MEGVNHFALLWRGLRMLRLKSLGLLCCWSLLGAPLLAQDLTTTLQRVPESANMLVVVDMTRLMQSNLAAKEGWTQQRSLDYLSGKTAFPPSTKSIVTAAQFNPALHQYDWQIGLLQFQDPVDPYVVAKREGSDVEFINGKAIVASRRNSYFLQFDRYNFGMYVPAHRQNFTRWVDFAKDNTTTKVSQYLIDSVQAGGAMGQFSVAMDLKNSFNKNAVRQRLGLSKAMTNSKADMDAWTRFIMGTRGLRFSVNVDNDITAELQLDFSEDVQPFADMIPGLVLEVFGGFGFHSGEIGSWKASSSGKSFKLRGNLDQNEVRKIAGLVLPMMPNTEPDDNLPPEKLKIVTSQRFLRACDSIMTDVRARSDQYERTKNFQEDALWFEYYAKKIDQLPTVNVDEDLLQYAANLTGKFRDMADSLRGVDIQNRVLTTYEVNAWTGASWGGQAYYGGTGFAGNSYSSNAHEIAQAKAENAAKGAKYRNQIWVQLGDSTNAIRRRLSDKYKEDF
jgi:hypothetical protein